MEISALHVPVDVYIFRYRPAHEAFVDKRNFILYGKGTSHCHCTAVYMMHCVSYMKQTMVWGSVAHDTSLICEITQLQYASSMKHACVALHVILLSNMISTPVQVISHRPYGIQSDLPCMSWWTINYCNTYVMSWTNWTYFSKCWGHERSSTLIKLNGLHVYSLHTIKSSETRE